MNHYEVWCEGFAATGESAPARKMGEIDAATFQEACDYILSGDPYYNPTTLTHWGCRLFPDETSARKAFG